MDKTCFSWLKLVQKSDLPANAKYLCHYLSTFMNLHQDMAWPSYSRIVSETGLSKSSVAKWLGHLELEGWLKRHRGDSTTNTRYKIDIPECALREADGSALNGLRSAPSGLGVVRSTDTNNKSNNNLIPKTLSRSLERPPVKAFTKPTIDEVRDHCEQNRYTFDPEAFWHYYESSGWKVGNKPMKSWRSACVTWQKRQGNGLQKGGGNHPRKGAETFRLRDIINEGNDTEGFIDGQLFRES